jgi:hypothetical protein
MFLARGKCQSLSRGPLFGAHLLAIAKRGEGVCPIACRGSFSIVVGFLQFADTLVDVYVAVVGCPVCAPSSFTFAAPPTARGGGRRS